MTVLTADELAGAHSYLAASRPGWSRSMASIRNEGGPWKCPGCNHASLLTYRCSRCGKDLAGSGPTTARQS